MHYNSFCGTYSQPTLSNAPNIDLINDAWKTDLDFLNLFKECDARSDCVGVNFKDPLNGDGFSLRQNNPIVLSSGAQFEWCATLTFYQECEERVDLTDEARPRFTNTC